MKRAAGERRRTRTVGALLRAGAGQESDHGAAVEAVGQRIGGGGPPRRRGGRGGRGAPPPGGGGGGGGGPGGGGSGRGGGRALEGGGEGDDPPPLGHAAIGLGQQAGDFDPPVGRPRRPPVGLELERALAEP